MSSITKCFYCLCGIISRLVRRQPNNNPKHSIPPAIEIVLNRVDYKDTEKYVPPISYGKVVKVYDGDTITIASRLPNGSQMFRFSVRLAGIDCAEIKAHSMAEKEEAELVRNILSEKILGKIVFLENVSIEKYGRLLADVYYEGEHINKWMLDNGHAVPYDGGTKLRPERWD